MPSDEEFEGQLRHIARRQGDDPPELAEPGTGLIHDDDLRPKISFDLLKTAKLAPSAGMFTLMALFAFGALAMAYNQTRPSPEDLARLETNARFLDERSMFDRVIQEFFTPLEAPGYKHSSPIYFLPPAPEGWVRVTEADIQAPDPLGDIAAKWPSDGPSIVQNRGFDRLSFYLKHYADPDIETKVTSRTRTRALYLNPNGTYLEVFLRFRQTQSALGTPNDPAGWTATLHAEAEAKREPTEVLETIQLAGLDVINRAAPNARHAVSRPIGGDLDTPTGMDLAVALHETAALYITGFAPPHAAEMLITGFDRPALAER